MKTVSQVKSPENRQELVQRLRRKVLFKEKSFEFRVKQMRGEVKYRISCSVECLSRRGLKLFWVEKSKVQEHGG